MTPVARRRMSNPADSREAGGVIVAGYVISDTPVESDAGEPAACGYLRVITRIAAIWFLLPAPGVAQEVDQGPKFGPAEVAKLPLVQLGDHRIESGKKIQPLTGYASANKTPVFSLTAAHHQACIL